MPNGRRQRSPWLRAGVGLACLAAAAWCGLRLVPLPAALFTPPPPGWVFTDRHGEPLRQLPGTLGFARRVTFEQLPQSLVHATLAAEDKRFWDHHGVDWRASARALVQLMRYRRIISGGSTISQQVIKLAHPRPRTPLTKCLEAIQAMRLEQRWTKERVLAEYLNRIDYGNLCLGPAEAAAFYFAKPLADLSVAEAAFLAGLPQAPGRLNPHRHFERALRRQKWILGRMCENGWLTANEQGRAAAERIELATPDRVFRAPHFVDLILQARGGSLALRRAAELRHSDSRVIPTTLDLELNQVVQRALTSQLAKLSAHRARNGAVVVLDNRTGGVQALVGSEDYFEPKAGQVNGAWARRSPGSALKPFTYLLAFERGDTPATVVADVPTDFPTPTGVFQPVNYNRQCYGPMRYRLALANSLNISAVKVLAALGGAEALQRRLQDWGLTTLERPPDFYGLGLTIGNAEVRLLELANAYAALARLGDFRPYRLLAAEAQEPWQSVGQAQVPAANSPASGTEAAAWLIADILSDNQARALAFGLDSNLRFAFPVACKTGTSSDFRDNWAIGYTPEFTVAVWIGNFDGSPMDQVSGVTGAAPVLQQVFVHLHEHYGTSWYTRPAAIVERVVHPITGRLLNSHGDGLQIGGRARSPLRAAASHVDSGSRRAEDCAPYLPAVAFPEALSGSTNSAFGGVVERFALPNLPPQDDGAQHDSEGRVRLPAEYAGWLASGDNWLAGRAVLAQPETPASLPLRIVNPLPGSTFFLDPDLPESSRWIRLTAEGGTEVQWHSDSLECQPVRGQVRARLAEGRHVLVAQDRTSGQQAESWIVVKPW